ncbi:hypothetical protein FKW77_010395 [Venturia effusa]|uniref:Uncharacterized protein n=1 Tax=Venturia effusa TaxID=50376 RepID=A0A517L4I3_9PEZI|nr:hypothetical protein FKW77_010395 [Venturia effusa]
MFQPTNLLALLALAATTVIAAPNDLQKRFQCLPDVPVSDCSAKAGYFYACLNENKVSAAECAQNTANITASNRTPNTATNPPATPLQKRYQCLPTVSAEDCTAKSNFFSKCANANLTPVEECYAQSLNVTAQVNDQNTATIPPTTPLQKRYECDPTVPVEDCTAKSEYFNKCIDAKLTPVEECYNQSLNVTAQANTSSKK